MFGCLRKLGCLVLILAALTLSMQKFTVPDPGMPWEMKDLIDNLFMTLGSAAVALLIPLVAARWLLPNLPAQAKIVSDTTLAGARAVDPEVARVTVGETGVAKTPLRPYGKAVFAGETLEVSSRGEFIEAGQAVEVCRVEGNKVVVRPRGTA